MRSLLVIMLFYLPSTILFAQGFNIESHIEKLVHQGDESQNRRYYDLLLYYYDNPIDINKTNYEELNQLGILSQENINTILEHINTTGPFIKIYEIQSLPAFTPAIIEAILPFITVSETKSLGKVFKGLFGGTTNYATLGYSRVVELSRAYKESIYLGSPDRLQTRIRLRNPGHLSIGLAAQKDPGETWLSQSAMPTTDYLSAHIYLENQGRIKQLVIGDYRQQFGQGLVLGGGFMVGKNVETVAAIKQSNLGILPYSSITEADFFRGTAVNIELSKHLSLAMFYSNQKLDATMAQDSSLEAVTTIRVSGLHRTTSEILAANQLHEQVWGSTIVYANTNFSTGLLLVNSQFDKPIIPLNRNYNQFNFTGKKLLNYSWFGQYQAGNFLFFGEVAKTYKAGFGINLGLIGSVSKYISLSMLFRSFDKDFHSLYGLPFSERSSIGNEKGFYWGIKIYPLARLEISAYYDIYHFPWITSITAAPASGYDYLLRSDYKLNDHAKIFLQVRNERSQAKETTGRISQNQSVNLLKTLLSFDYNLEKPLTFRSRIQYNRFTNKKNETGWLIYQDINYDRMKFGFTGRILLFDTESWGARQYVYEKDMLFTFNTKVYNGQGVSYYVIIKYKPVRNLSIRAKWGYIEYLNQKTIGSGNDIIYENHKTQLTAQIHYRF